VAYGMRIISVSLIAVFYFNDNFIGWILLVSNITYILSILYLKFKDKKVTQGSGVIVLNSLLKEGKWLIGSTFVFFLSSQLYIFIIATFNSLEDVAIISAVLLPIGLIRPISISAEGYIIPKISQMNKNEQWYGFIKEASFFYVPIALISFIIILFPEPILEFFFDRKYSDSSFYLCLAALNSLISITIYFFSFYLRVLFKNNKLFKINILSLIITFPLGVWCIANNGVDAYFFVLLSNNIIILGLTILLIKKSIV
jgi:O-antigen/teichoic acid export membrane protein